MSSVDLERLARTVIKDIDERERTVLDAVGRRLVVLGFLRHFG